MDREIRIDGIYDQETFMGLRDIPISNIGFDFRPKSFNFLQHYRFMDILEKLHNPSERYFLHFCDETNTMISKFLKDLAKRYPMANNFLLEFSDNQTLDFYKQFKYPFFWHYRPDENFNKLFDLPHFKGLVLSHSFLTGLHERGRLNNFIRNFHQLFYRRKDNRRELALSLEWNSNIFPSLFDLFEFDMICLPINKKVEQHYRKVDMDMLKKELSFY